MCKRTVLYFSSWGGSWQDGHRQWFFRLAAAGTAAECEHGHRWSSATCWAQPHPDTRHCIKDGIQSTLLWPWEHRCQSVIPSVTFCAVKLCVQFMLHRCCINSFIRTRVSCGSLKPAILLHFFLSDVSYIEGVKSQYSDEFINIIILKMFSLEWHCCIDAAAAPNSRNVNAFGMFKWWYGEQS